MSAEAYGHLRSFCASSVQTNDIESTESYDFVRGWASQKPPES